MIVKSNAELLQLYLSELCVPVADVAGRRQLRSASRRLLYFPRYNMSNYGRRAFSYAGHHAWNLHARNVRKSTFITIFKRSLDVFIRPDYVLSALEMILFV